MRPPQIEPATLVDLVEARASIAPSQRLYTFLEDSEGDESTMTYAQLDDRARLIAAELQKVAKPGDRVMLLYPPGLEYIAGYFGCLYAGMVAVPAYPPDPMRLERTLPRLRAIIQDAQASVVLTVAFIHGMGEFLFEQAPDLRALHWMATDDLAAEPQPAWKRPELRRESLAFLQYTSGSTGTPKGVMLSHGNLLHNLECIARSFGTTEESVGVIWLPPYHDMGLIGGILQPLYRGFPVALMSPLTFLKQPRRWLQAVSRFGATVSGGPNFAYDLALRKMTPEERAQLDLSRWKVAFTGAEPVRTETMERFMEAFGPQGFRREFIYPCYGLAEGTLIASGGDAAKPPRVMTLRASALARNEVVTADPADPDARLMVGCGQTMPEQELLIADLENTRRCPPGRVGEIWVRGPSVALGYWQRPEETQHTFHGQLSDSGEGPWLRTGDLGFLREDGELFITGRLKDLIIIRGRNHYPQDIEMTVEQSHPALRPGCGAAFALEVEGEERLVVVQEVDPRKLPDPPESLVGIIRQRVAELHELQLHSVVLIEPGSIPKTSSGKIQRRACRTSLVAGELRPVLSWEESRQTETVAPQAAAAPVVADAGPVADENVEAWLLERLPVLLRVRREEVDASVPLTRMGLDSMASVEMTGEIERVFGVSLPMEALLQGPSTAELARLIIARRAESSATRITIARRTSDVELPLSFAQQRLWFLDQLEPDNAFYNIPTALRLEGTLDVSALERSFATLLKRHESLRTTVSTVDGRASQVIAPEASLPLPVVDLSALPESARREEARRLITEEARKPFDLARGPLLRVTLLKLGGREHLLLATMHHILSDGWSMGVLVRELAQVYEAFLAGRKPELPGLPIQYADYALWLRGWMKGEVLEQQLGWWRKYLAGAPPVLELPTDRPRPAVQTYRGAKLPVHLPRELAEGLDALSLREGVTPFMALLAAFKVLLHRCSGQIDLTVGTPIAGRERPETHGLIGLFVNTLVLRTNLEAEPTFRELLQRVREGALGAYAHQDVPFEKLVDELQPVRDLSRTPLFQVMFVLQNAQGALPQMPGLRLSTEDTHTGTAMFDLHLSLSREEQGLVGAFEYNTDLFDGSTITRLGVYLTNLLKGIVADPGQRISRLPMLPEAERQRVLVDWNQTALPRPAEARLHLLVEQQVDRTPEAVAVTSEGQSLTYRQLDQRANQLAHHLLSLGVGPEIPVGVCTDRSIEMVVALLGILKAGSAYVPIDPSYPQDRLAYMLQDSNVRVLLTQQHLVERLPASAATRVCLDSQWSQIAAHGTARPQVPVDAQGLAYIIYTSGSTGRPKGAMNFHQAICNRLLWMQEAYGLGAQDAVLQKTPFSFDVSVWEFFWTLMTGARLVVAKPGGHQDAAYLVDLIQRERITTLHFVPSMLQVFLEQPGVEQCRGLKRVICSGEALAVEHVERFHSKLKAGLHNLYGPTEAAVDVTFWECKPGDKRRSIPIGRPVSNTRMYVLDGQMNPVPVGVPGELYIGGVQPARGYWNRPELTAEKFVPDPYATQPGARLYRTGDLARFLPGGEIEYLGRIDNQVKVRGFRIELGEIESALLQHPALKEAVVVAREDSPGDKRLVAYVVAAGQEPTRDELRAHLGKLLPEYMVPMAFVSLAAMPLSPNGKLDRKMLPAPQFARPERTYVAPETHEEKVLATLFAEVLGLEQVGAEDNFFELGGDSIRSIPVVARAGQQGLRFSVAQLFQNPTPRALARALGNETARPEQTPRTSPFSLVSEKDRSALPEGLEDAFPMSSLQLGMVFHAELNPEKAVYLNVNHVRLEGRFERGAMEQALADITARHAILRTSYALTGYSEPLQLIHRAAQLPLTVKDLRGQSAEQQEAVLAAHYAAEHQQRFDLTRPPLLRCTAHLLSEDTFELGWTEHHVIGDGWSINSLIAELFEHYLAHREGTPPAVAPLPEQSFRDFIVMEREAMRGEATRAFWAGQVKGLVPGTLTRWPHPAENRPAPAFHQQRVAISSELSQALKQVARNAGVPIKTVLLAAHVRVMGQLSAQRDVVTGLVCNGRPETADGDQVKGLFLNTLPFRMELEPGRSWRELLQETFRHERDLLPHRRFPLSEVQRAAPGVTLFETMFDFTHFHMYRKVMDRGGLKLLGSSEFARTNFALAVEAGLDFVTSDVRVQLYYDPSDLPDAQMQALAGHYAAALEQIARDPSARHDARPLLPEDERRRVLVEWNQTALPRPAEARLHLMVEQQVDRTPDAPAVTYEGQSLTYRELDQRANQLAHHLLSLGVGPEVPVGVCTDRSLEMVVALLGILKAGGAYVPLDPGYPQDRLAYMLQDSSVRVLLTQQHLVERLPDSSATRVCLDSQWSQVAAHSTARPQVPVEAQGLAYIIYTSGSTGRPKGAMNFHRAICNRLLWMQEAYGLGTQDSVLQKTPFSFDVSVWEFFWTLMMGARLVVAKPGGHQDPGYLVDLIQRERITTLHFVPSMLQVFLEQSGVEQCRGLKRVVCSGEALGIELVERFHSKLKAELHNLYGPTEAAVDVTFFECKPGDKRRTIPIGRPVANTQMYVLDGHLHPVPVGVAGELYIGGVQPARGYWNRPELTAEKFIPDPYATEPGARLYRTGDLARFLPDGEIEYLGRIDNQVKVRGFRIELGEIESALLQHPALKETVVVAREDVPGDKRLVAYYVATGQAPSLEELRAHLGQRLPEHMVPAAFVPLAAMPLSPNGKLDRKALPAPEGLRLQSDTPYVEPRTELERNLARLWQEVLGVEQVGIHDRFFDVGGNSLLLVRAHGRLCAELGLEIALTELFKYPSIGALASYLAGRTNDGPDLRQESQERADNRRTLLEQRRRVRRAGRAEQDTGETPDE
ncbi:MAG TPA: amino acid adenylation domain-containing protein [Archangium sp.]|uniref:non-ribosomal peptide synthetase n=1 Tax=Archangium sp. TaxID=1872627 RepID=UPI002E34BDDC|nr:non-ribosomal peptide synthetase [Archangium sp.]HEX5746348.1 amino acid adenylation domain-containing protein [Archangium sp.]